MRTALGCSWYGQSLLRRWVLAGTSFALLFVISDFSPVRAANSAEEAALVKSGAIPARSFTAHDTSVGDDAAQQVATSEPGTALTIYNQNFFVARELVPLDLKAGVNEAHYTGVAAHLEPDSVILRDPGGRALQILEQNYRNDPVTQELLLSFYEAAKLFAAGLFLPVMSTAIRSRPRRSRSLKSMACCVSDCQASQSFQR
jgi:hypothetical protein